MDIADDIAYAVHDLDDFYRAGIQKSIEGLGRITCGGLIIQLNFKTLKTAESWT